MSNLNKCSEGEIQATIIEIESEAYSNKCLNKFDVLLQSVTNWRLYNRLYI